MKKGSSGKSGRVPMKLTIENKMNFFSPIRIKTVFTQNLIFRLSNYLTTELYNIC